MQYQGVVAGTFISRPNRFIALCNINGKQEVCHVKNTGRCKELLTPGCKVYLQHCPSPTRKTAYDVIAVEKNGVLFNIDSMAPNVAVAEWLPSLLPAGAIIKPEYQFGNSRMDFYAEYDNTKLLVEVKGVTLEQDGVARFPDAPTARGVKHLKELTQAVKRGYRAMVVFVIQTQGVTRFEPNDATDPAFGQALRQAKSAGVEVLVYDCLVTPDSMTIHTPISMASAITMLG